ncbi:hypothetical protein GCM10010246_06170 [Streptomyces cuspidosporus]|uniref:Peptidase S1 domain-containing protein n=1 Tax=Streptomyces cuspidosporus TaxID=66882 RepID=A0ABP5S9D0_9ACTN
MVQKGRDGRWELIGVTSGPGAPNVPCSKGPGLYSSAPAYTGWIAKTMKANRAPAPSAAAKGSALAETGTDDNAAAMAGVAAALIVADGGTALAVRRGKARRAA